MAYLNRVAHNNWQITRLHSIQGVRRPIIKFLQNIHIISLSSWHLNFPPSLQTVNNWDHFCFGVQRRLSADWNIGLAPQKEKEDLMRGQMAHLHVTRAHAELTGSMLKIIVLARLFP